MAVRGSVAIVGAAESDIGAVAALMSPIDLMAQGIHRALADARATADVLRRLIGRLASSGVRTLAELAFTSGSWPA